MVMSERVQQFVFKDKKGGERKPSLEKQKVLTFHKNVFNRSYYEDLTFSWQQKLYSKTSIQVEDLRRASLYICPRDYAEVLIERNVISLCGYPLCSLPPREFKSDTYLSAKDRKLYDVTTIKPFCSDVCFGASRFFEVQLSSEPVYLRDFKRLVPVEVVPYGISVSDYMKTRKSTDYLIQQEKAVSRKNFIDNRIRSIEDEVIGEVASLVDDIKLQEHEQNKNSSETTPNLVHTAIEGYSAPLAPSFIKHDHVINVRSNPDAASGESVGSDENFEEELKGSDDEGGVSVKSGATTPKLTIFGKLFLLLDHSTTTDSRKLFDHIQQSQDPITPRKRFIKKTIPRDSYVVVRRDLLSKLLLERLRFLTQKLNLNISFHHELIAWIDTLDLYEPEMAYLTPSEALCLCMVFLTRLARCFPANYLSSVSGDKMASLATSVGFDLEKIQFLSRCM